MGISKKEQGDSHVIRTEPGPPRNLLIASLPEESRRRIETVAENVSLEAKQIVHKHDKPLTHALFPSNGLLSVIMKSADRAVEIAMIGDEGFFGLPLFFGTDDCPMEAISQADGEAIRIRSRDFLDLLRADPSLVRILGRYAQAYFIMLARSAVCCSAHMVEQRYAKWLLLAQDRLRTDRFAVTQEFLAEMLAVRRSTVSEVAEKIKREHLIQYRQGRMAILDRRGLEDLACPCYAAIRREFDRMLSPQPHL